MNQGEGPRLGFQVDTSGLERATTAAAQAASKIQPLGDVADRAAQRLTATGRAAQQAATATGNAAQQIENIARATELATAKFGLLSGAVGGLVSMLGFQLVGAANAAANAIARLPGEAARAVDQINMLQSKLNFAFRGNTAVAGQARADILAIAQRNGIPLQQAMQAYGEIGVSARGTGISQSAVTGVTQAFNNLAQISGAGPSQTNAAIYQFQQALSKGSLQYQDFRYILNSLPAFDYALGKGLGRTPGELMQMVGSGQIDAQKLVKGFTDGVAIIEKESGGIPETVERSQNRLRNSWELMLVSMGETLKTGPLLRAWNDFQQKIIDGMRVSMSPESDPQGAIVQLLAQARNQNAGRPYRRGQDFLTAPQREKLNYLLSLLNARETERRVGQNFDESDSLMERNQQVAADARQSNAISTQRSQIEEQIKKYSETLATGVGLNGRSYDEIRAARDTLRAQLKRTLSPFDIYQLDSGSRLGNRAAYGSDAAGIADRAYEMAISERGALGASDEDTIRAYLFNEDRRGKLISFAAGAATTRGFRLKCRRTFSPSDPRTAGAPISTVSPAHMADYNRRWPASARRPNSRSRKRPIGSPWIAPSASARPRAILPRSANLSWNCALSRCAAKRRALVKRTAKLRSVPRPQPKIARRSRRRSRRRSASSMPTPRNSKFKPGSLGNTRFKPGSWSASPRPRPMAAS
ncbi:MAG: hypothetical protein EBZ50_01600 [Alphaproteobacteria bacterium]|nr:hypothetical protein [Alphaproteobacteria bacterium]